MNKLTFNFESGICGWSESWWTNQDYDYYSIPGVIENMIDARMELAATLVYCRGAKISSATDGFRFAQHFELPPGGIPGKRSSGLAAPNDATAFNYKDDCLLAEFSCPALFLNTPRSFRGFPDASETNGEIPASVLSQYRAWLNALLEFYTLNGIVGRRTSIGLLGNRITGFGSQTADNPEVKIIAAAGSTLPDVGSVIRIRSMKPWGKLNRSWTVKEVNAGTNAITLSGSQFLQAKGAPDSGEYLIPEYDAAAYASVRLVGVSSRKTGRPSNGPRGRASTTRSY